MVGHDYLTKSGLSPRMVYVVSMLGLGQWWYATHGTFIAS
jgi:hypothetical protein